MKKLTGIKKATGKYNHWQGDACVMLDVSDGRVWTDTFIGSGSWKVYHSHAIVTLFCKRGIWTRDDTTSMADVRAVATDVLGAAESLDKETMSILDNNHLYDVARFYFETRKYYSR